MEKTFNEAFLERLFKIVGEVESEDMPPYPQADDLDHDDPIVGRPEQEQGIKEACQQCEQLFARIVQLLADRDGAGDIAGLSDPKLTELVRVGIGLADQWAEGKLDRPAGHPAPRSELNRLIAEHCELGEFIINVQDEMIEAHVKSRRRR